MKPIQVVRDVYWMQGANCFGVVQTRHTALVIVMPKWHRGWQLKVFAHKCAPVAFQRGVR